MEALSDDRDREAPSGELAAIDRLLLRELQRLPAPSTETASLLQALAASHDPPPRLAGLERAVATFNLSPFERDILLLALTVEIDDRYAAVFAALQGAGRLRPSIGLAVRLFAGQAGAAPFELLAPLGPHGHLQRSGLLDLVGDGPHALRELRIAAAFWPRLLGESPPSRFPVEPRSGRALSDLVLAPSTRADVTAALDRARRHRPSDLCLVLRGDPGSGRATLARSFVAALGYQSIGVDGPSLDDSAIRALACETAWHRAAVLVAAPVAAGHLALLCRELSVPVAILAQPADRFAADSFAARAPLEIAIAPLDTAERSRLWHALLGATERTDLDLATLAARFRFGPGRIADALARARSRDARLDQSSLHEACRAISTPPPTSIASVEPCEPADLVLPPATRRELQMVQSWARHAATAFRPGAPGARARPGENLVCLFSGAPGTGKTMAARVLAQTLALDLFVVDLSRIVDKYIGETEKNLDRLFADADAAGAILFFDEADALFARRTEIRDAHDRYANLETAYLLQRLESHRGIAILATNVRRNLDEAFLRRIHIAADFPLPGPPERLAIFQRHLSQEHLAPDVDLSQLAATKFPISGADIRNAVVAAVLFAADDSTQVTMRHLVLGLWRELHKTGRVSSPHDFAPWTDLVRDYLRADG